uniref:Src kinase-associated phosphoprotein 1 n=1 Tax=Leptobrachium leishanense TaxID=445787 RepID=A0A8C5QDG3_9ANUR
MGSSGRGSCRDAPPACIAIRDAAPGREAEVRGFPAPDEARNPRQKSPRPERTVTGRRHRDMENRDIPPDVMLLLGDVELFLSDCLQYEKISDQGREIGETLLNGCMIVRKRYQTAIEQKGEVDHEVSDENPSYGMSLASDATSMTSDYLDDDPGDAENLGRILKQGYLEKRKKDYGFFGSEWHKRWCVLTKGSFCYYSSEKGKMPKGGFPIQGCSACLVSDIRKDSRRDACFQLMSPGNRVCQFTAPSPADAREWVDSVQFIVKDIMSPNIPCEEADDDDDESYDDVDSLSSSAALAAPLDRTDSPQDDDDIYEVVPDDEEFAHPEDPKRASDHTQSGFCVIKYEDYYQGLWNCTSDNWDELSFQRGDLIRILSKEYNAYGWWVGELDGEIGIVPKDYLSTAFDLEGM